MEEFKLHQGLKPMAILTHDKRGPCSKETVGGIAFKIDALALGRYLRIPLVRIVA